MLKVLKVMKKTVKQMSGKKPNFNFMQTILNENILTSLRFSILIPSVFNLVTENKIFLKKSAFSCNQ